MPRGVYDRSKLKKNTDKAPEKTVEKVAKGKPGRKPKAEAVKAASIPQELKKELVGDAGLAKAAPIHDTFTIGRATEVLVNIRNAVGSGSSLTAEIDNKLMKLADAVFISALGGTVEKVQVAQVEEVEEVKTETAPVQAAPAPVEFIPPPAPAVVAPLPFNLPPVNG